MHCVKYSKDWYYEGNTKEVEQRLSEKVYGHIFYTLNCVWYKMSSKQVRSVPE